MNTNDDIQTAFFDAIRKGDHGRVIALTDQHPGLIHQRDQRGFTPLILAHYSGQDRIAQWLITMGVEIDAQDASGNTALMGVCFKGFENQARMLILHGADVNIRNHQGATALTYAATFGHLAIVDLLIASGADPTSRDGRGLSPADHARMQGLSSTAAKLDARAA